ncbi:MAG: efflux RND transporter periplasmic adaptor subunit [Proteobacteria bacterium]|nr:efflux RND transporter periplasmic adaptor subunit [Pseudomonadota bacterium]
MKRFILFLAIISGVTVAGYQTRDTWLSPAASNVKPTPPPQPAQPVLAADALQRAVPVEIATIGTVQPIAMVLVKSRIDGEIAKIHFGEGQEVKEGDPLFTLDARALTAQLRQVEATLARDRAQLVRAQLEQKRQHELVQRDFSSRQKLEQSEADAAALQATVQADEALVEAARVNLSYTSIRAQITGRTGAVSLKQGNTVKANDTLVMVTLTQMRPIYVSFTVPERQLTAIRAARARGDVPVAAFAPGQATPIETGALTFIDNQVDTTTGTIILKATYQNAENRLWPGQFVNVRLTLGVQQDALVVPSAALQTGQSGFYVFVIAPDMAAHVRPVTVTRTHEDLIVIGDGLKPNEKVVIDGQLRLTEGTKVRIQTPAAQPAAAAVTEPRS